MDVADDTLRVTLTGRAPVAIVKTDWPVVARAVDDTRDDGDFTGYSPAGMNHKWVLRVRRHGDGRVLVYGTAEHEGGVGEPYRAGGRLLTSDSDIPGAIYAVAESLKIERWLADRCIADLPAERI